MKKTHFYIGIALIGVLIGCKTSVNKTTLFNNDKQLQEKFDFELIKESLQNKRIVAIGESTHGIGEFYTLKSELVQYLHQELNFELLAFEGGFGDINLAWLNVDELNYSDLRDKSLFGNFRCKEVEPLFQYIKSNSQIDNPLILTGIDPQISGTLYEEYIDSLCSFLNLPINVDEEFSYYNQMFQATFEQDSTNFTNYRNRYQNTLVQIINGIKENRDSILNSLNISDLELIIISRTLKLQFEAVNYSFQERMNAEYIPKGIAIRDLLMAQNIEWILENLYPDKKIIIWGHNAHIQSGSSNSLETNWMGQYLKEKYGDDYFSIGLFAYKGTAYQHWNKESLDFENSDQNHIEYIMTKGMLNYSFQDFSEGNVESWINEPVKAFELENNGIVNFVPSIRFDAVICILEGNIPSFQ